MHPHQLSAVVVHLVLFMLMYPLERVFVAGVMPGGG